MNISKLKARYAAYQFRSASSDDERIRAANQLVELGQPGIAELLAFIQTGDEPVRAVAIGALDRHLANLPDGDRRAVAVAGQVLESLSSAGEPGRVAVLPLLPSILKRTGSTYAARCHDAVASGLKTGNVDARVLSIRLALHPDLKLRPELMPLLNDPEPRVRGAALFAVATVSDGAPLMADEELFHWLHDPDAGVRKVCYDALVSRDRSETEISLARRLFHPAAGERLKLLYDLRYEDEVVDPEPWLERLSRDSEPAVRAGAARVVFEVFVERKLSYPAWVARLIEGDPDPTVRRIASYYRKASIPATAPVRPAGNH